MVKNYLSPSERATILKSMSVNQRETLFKVISKSHRSNFAGILAKYKGTKDWTLYSYIDHGSVRKNIKCECGRPLRYQYILINLKTKEKRSLGETHFQEELGIPDHIAKAVIKGIHEIHYEYDELLQKYYSDWELPECIKKNLRKIDVPDSIKQLLNAGLPLLTSHLNLLYSEISKVNQRRTYTFSTKNGTDTYEHEIKNEEIYKILIGEKEPFSYIDRFQEGIKKYIRQYKSFYISDLIHFLSVRSGLPFEKVNGEHALIAHFEDYLMKRGYIKQRK